MSSRVRLLSLTGLLISAMLLVAGCGSDVSENIDENHDVTVAEDSSESEIEVESDEGKSLMTHVEAMKGVKNPLEHNPVITQKYTADPYAMVYDGRVYLYMTGDEPMNEADGSRRNNDYSNINTIRIVSSDDMVNWTYHGEVMAAGANGAASWGNNSWAPAACVKVIDGKPKFFLYFANSGNGIAVLTSDSPTGPFTDPLGEALVSRNTPTCAEVTWLFDPAVLVDDDGTGYLYFGGGVPNPDMASNPGTARVVKLSDDMIHLDGNPVPIDNVLYLFEDSGINKVGDKYIYSYCSNFSVPAGGCEGYGFGCGEIIQMVGDSPMGPFKTVGSILKNPEHFFKNGGNNHHCMFEYEGKWYVTYHASLIEEKQGLNTGYRSVNIDDIGVSSDNVFEAARGTKEGVAQVRDFNPYEEHSFSTMSAEAGIKMVPGDEESEECGSGNMNVFIENEGAYIQLSGVDFEEGADALEVTLRGTGSGSILVRTKYLNGEDIAVLTFDATDDYATYEIDIDDVIKGVQDLFFVFSGTDYELKSWQFK